MKQELIDKLLQEQTTPEEEHLIAQLLRQENEAHADQWLLEDETETYDRMVRQRRFHHMVRWTVAAVVVALLVAGAVVLWTRHESGVGNHAIVAHETVTVPVSDAKGVGLDTIATHETVTVPVAPVLAKKSAAPKRMKIKSAARVANTADSLQIYIERLEQELAQVSDSSYTEKAEQIIRADARLQRLVQRIMIGEIVKRNQTVEAMTTNETMEELP